MVVEEVERLESLDLGDGSGEVGELVVGESEPGQVLYSG